MQEGKTNVEKILEEILKGIGIFANIESIEKDDYILLNITDTKTDELIRKDGLLLDAIQHITNKIAYKYDQDIKKKIVVDTEGYREKKEERLKKLTCQLAKEVKRTGKEYVTELISAYDRRIIHLTLQNDPDITTTSVGEGNYKKIIISQRSDLL